MASISLSDSDPSSSVELMWKQDEPVADFTIYAFDDSTPAVKVNDYPKKNKEGVRVKKKWQNFICSNFSNYN